MRYNLLAAVAFATSAVCAPVNEAASSDWDVIVVGAGPAGIIVADRMAEAGKKTLLLEQGGPSYGVTGGTEKPSWLSGTKLSRVDVPGLYSSIFSVATSMLCSSSIVSNAFQACTIGGNSAINAGLFFQPPASDFDKYFPHDWKSADMQSAISKLNDRQPSELITSENHKQYLQRGYQQGLHWLKHLGFKETNFKKDPNDKTKVYGHAVYDYIDGQRGGPVISYLQSALKRSNFKMQSNTKALRIVRQGGQAKGVAISHNGQKSTARLAQGGRVIISGGALQSPALLMHSGIGNPSTLGQMRAGGALKAYSPKEWINNTAVGDGLFDNPNTFIQLSSNDVKAYDYSYNDPKTADKNLYLKKRSGPYATAGETAAFWDTVPRSGGGFTTCQGTLGASGNTGYTGPHDITLQVYGTSGLGSSGSVGMTNNFTPQPTGGIYYSDPEDAQSIATFIHRILSALPQSTFTSQNIPQSSSVQDIVNFITSHVGTVNHWSSSCRFGKCVDVDTVVKGTQNIHVVDASILPPLSVNPQMGVMIAAERASERILAL